MTKPNIEERRAVKIGYGTLFYELQFPKIQKPNQIEILFVSYGIERKEIMFSFEKFKEEILKALREAHPDYQFVEEKVPKINYNYIGVSICETGENSGLVLNLSEYYTNYLKEKKAIQEIIRDMWDTYIKFMNENRDIKSLPDLVNCFEKIKDKIFCRVINRDKNHEAISTMPYVDILNLLCVFYIDLGQERIINIRNGLLDMWGICREELAKVAIQNMLRECKLVCISIMELTGEKGIVPMWFVSMEKDGSKTYGASIILFKELLNDLLEKNNIPKQCFVIPSSIHELIIVPAEINIEELNRTINIANTTCIDISEFLSDEAYYFDREKVEIQLFSK